jgi:hypothetical protein
VIPLLLDLETTVQEFHQREWLGNPFERWTKALAVLLAVFLLLAIGVSVV